MGTATTQLEQLPTEVLGLITEAISPGDIENFAICSRYLRAIAAPRLKKHRQLRKKFEHTVVRDDGMIAHTQIHPLLLLHQIWQEPMIEWYIKRLTIASYNESWLPSDHDGEDYRTAAQRWHSLLEIYECSMSGDALHEQLLEGKVGAVCGLILRKLHQVRELRFSTTTWNDELREALRTHMKTGSCLSKLETVRSKLPLTYCRIVNIIDRAQIEAYSPDADLLDDWGAMEQVDCQEVFQWCDMVPSLRVLSARCMSSMDNDIRYLQQMGKHLECLHLTEAEINCENLEGLCRSLTGLREFAYASPKSAFYSDIDWDVSSIVEVLVACQADSLEVLTLRDHGRELASIVDLQPFKKLRKFTGHMGMLINPTCVWTGGEYEVKHRLESTKVFPASIAAITLIDDVYSNSLIDVGLLGISSLENLRRVAVQNVELTKSTKRELADKQIRLCRRSSSKASHEKTWTANYPIDLYSPFDDEEDVLELSAKLLKALV